MRCVLASRVSPATPLLPGASHPMSAQPVKSVAVLPTWIEAIIPRSTAADHTTSQSGWPGAVGAGRPAVVGVEEERAVPAVASVPQLGRDGGEIGQVDDGDAVQPIGVIAEHVAEEVVASRDGRGRSSPRKSRSCQ